MPFYFAVLEQYYTGEMILPVINGVDDGSVVLVCMCFASAYYGCIALWKPEVSIFGFPPLQVSYYFFYALSIFAQLSALD
jgi:hypothetical protein